jgi:hypothetical protein
MGGETGGLSKIKAGNQLIFIALVWVIAWPSAGLAQDLAPGEENIGILYYMTHLHPAAYFILFLIFLLSVANLYYQYVTPGGVLHPEPYSEEEDRDDDSQGMDALENSDLEYDQGAYARLDSLEMPAETVVAVRKFSPEEADGPGDNFPTPLEGVDHPLPAFSETQASIAPAQGEPPKDEPQTAPRVDDGSFQPQFVFTSMASLDLDEESLVENEEELRVTGFVIGPDDEPVPGVLVFLINEEGKRIGQSSRSQPGAGAFSAMAQEPGNYRLNAHKRGMRLVDRGPIDLAQTSGVIEDVVLRMVEEGCHVKGRIIKNVETDLDSLVRLQITCKVAGAGFVRTVRPAQDGSYSIPGTPESDSCVLELRDQAGNVITSTDPFETIDGGEVNLEFELIEEQNQDSGGEQEDTDTPENV